MAGQSSPVHTFATNLLFFGVAFGTIGNLQQTYFICAKHTSAYIGLLFRRHLRLTITAANYVLTDDNYRDDQTELCLKKGQKNQKRKWSH